MGRFLRKKWDAFFGYLKMGRFLRKNGTPFSCDPKVSQNIQIYYGKPSENRNFNLFDNSLYKAPTLVLKRREVQSPPRSGKSLRSNRNQPHSPYYRRFVQAKQRRSPWILRGKGSIKCRFGLYWGVGGSIRTFTVFPTQIGPNPSRNDRKNTKIFRSALTERQHD